MVVPVIVCLMLSPDIDLNVYGTKSAVLSTKTSVHRAGGCIISHISYLY